MFCSHRPAPPLASSVEVFWFQRVLRHIASGAPVDWAEVALAGGYCDQAHLGNEFRDFSGITPGAYLASDRPFVNHVPID